MSLQLTSQGTTSTRQHRTAEECQNLLQTAGYKHPTPPGVGRGLVSCHAPLEHHLPIS